MASKTAKNFTNKQNTHNANTRKSKFKDRTKFSKGKDEQVMDKKPGGNDPRWWGTADYVKSVASFNFASPLGMPVPYSYLKDPSADFHWKNSDSNFIGTVPGIMAIDVLPTMGVGRDAVDPVNQYIRTVFTKLRSTNNQNAPYQPCDLGMYIMAIDSIHMGIEQLIRMYGIARTYSSMNRYYPDALLRAMGINPSDSSGNIYSNLADMRASILNLMIKVQTLAIPKGININERHRELVKYVYKDGESVKAQMYLFRTPYLYKYDDSSSEQGGFLKAMSMPIGQGYAYWIAAVDDMINALATSSLFAIVSGDIIKSFTYEKLYNMPFFDELYTVVPVYNPEILLEIHNLKVCGDRWDDTAFDVTQDPNTGALICAPYTTTDTIPGPGSINCIIDIPVDNPEPDLVMVATRLATVGYTGYMTTEQKYKFVPICLGTEMVIRLNIYGYDESGTLVNNATTRNAMFNIQHVRAWFARELYFDWHPHIYSIETGSDPNVVSLCSVISELSNYTVVEAGDLTKMHEMAVYGALTIVDVDNVGLK